MKKSVLIRSAAWAGVVGVALSLSACGGGGDDSVASSTPEGLYEGTLSGSTSANFQALILETGHFWGLYGTEVGGTLVVNGFLQGNGTSSNGTFSSSNLKDFGVAPALSATLTSTYNSTATTLNGSVAFAAGTVNFQSSLINPANYNYDSPATLPFITGDWILSGLGTGTIAINIGSSGAYTALSSGGCALSGSITPRPSGKNVYNVSMTFGPAPCGIPGLEASGVAVAYNLATGAKQLIIAVVDNSRTVGVVTFGQR